MPYGSGIGPYCLQQSNGSQLDRSDRAAEPLALQSRVQGPHSLIAGLLPPPKGFLLGSNLPMLGLSDALGFRRAPTISVVDETDEHAGLRASPPDGGHYRPTLEPLAGAFGEEHHQRHSQGLDGGIVHVHN